MRCERLGLLLTVITASGLSVARDTLGLRDHPIESAGGANVYLDSGDWTVASAALNITVPASVPGDLLTDLQQAGVISDPWLDLTWIRNSSLWTEYAWTYTTQFAVPINSDTTDATTLLVFDGVKMGATVRVNGKVVGVVADQFLRYTFPLDPAELGLRESGNLLEVTFGVEDVAEDGRFMACTGGWDWAPYSYTSTNSSGATSGPANTLSKGLWKSVYLVRVPASSVAITHMTPHLKYLGQYPVSPLADGNHAGFAVNVTTHVWVPPGGAKGVLSVKGSWGVSVATPAGVESNPMTLPAGESRVSVQLKATAEQIKLWWPRGVGDQPLYNVSATWQPAGQGVGDATSSSSSSSSSSSKSTTVVRKIGFRVFALVTINDTDTATVAAAATAVANVTGKHGMFFRVNGAAIYSRGANMVPMEELEGRMDGEAHRILVKSVADAGMNTLRVWGGGIFYPTSFYDACDEEGVLVYHDMQYASDSGKTHGPLATQTQEAELRHQIRRLSHHPSIVLWDGANEQVINPNTSSYVYATFVMTVVSQEDQSRVVWPASPAAGWVTGVNMLYQTPNLEFDLNTHGGGHIYNMGIETHAPYQLGSGWPTVNGGVKDTCFVNPDTGSWVSLPNKFKASGNPGGVAEKNTYASEFGTGGSSSFESMSGTLSKEHWGLHGGMAADACSGWAQCLGFHNCTGDNPMTQRNYGCDGQIRLYWGNRTTVDLDATGEKAFKGQLYQCMLTQAIVLKQVYESRRAKNQLGHLIWMLNEIWPTVGWGSLEYGPRPGPYVTPGQVIGGRWKPVHYFYKRSLMTDVMATCGEEVCYLSNHRASRPFSGTVTLTAYDHFGDGKGEIIMQENMSLPQGPGAISFFKPPTALPAGNNTAVVSTVTDENGRVVSEHMVQLVTPQYIRVPEAMISLKIAEKANADGTIDIAVTSDKVALWVTLTTQAQGRFSDNAFLLPATTKTVQFIPFSKSTAADDLSSLKQSLRVEDYSMYRSLE